MLLSSIKHPTTYVFFRSHYIMLVVIISRRYWLVLHVSQEVTGTIEVHCFRPLDYHILASSQHIHVAKTLEDLNGLR